MVKFRVDRRITCRNEFESGREGNFKKERVKTRNKLKFKDDNLEQCNRENS